MFDKLEDLLVRFCPKHGYISGEHKFCPICDEEKKAEKRAAASRTEVA